MRRASCGCGQLTANVAGDPLRVSVCHCRECQKRTGGPFAAQARFPIDRVAFDGQWNVWERTGESGRRAWFRWCTTCGGMLGYTNEGLDDQIAIPIGAFAPGDLPIPTVTVFEDRKQLWLTLSPELTRET